MILGHIPEDGFLYVKYYFLLPPLNLSNLHLISTAFENSFPTSQKTQSLHYKEQLVNVLE
jgi:hypothetical protein